MSVRNKMMYVLLIIALIFVMIYIGYHRRFDKKPLPYDKKHYTVLSASEICSVSHGRFEITQPVSGSLVADNKTIVRSKQHAVIDKILVKEGDHVSAGQVIAVFNKDNLSDELKQKLSNYSAAQSKYLYAKSNLDKNYLLYMKHFISKDAIEDLESSTRVAKNNTDSSLAQVSMAEKSLHDATVRSTIDGYISEKFVNEGDDASVGEKLFDIVNVDKLNFVVTVPMNKISEIKIGQTVKFHVSGFDHKTFYSKVSRINPSASEETGQVNVYVNVENHDKLFKANIFAIGEIITSVSNHTFVVSTNNIHSDKLGHYVYIDGHNEVIKRRVILGKANFITGTTEVRSGLVAGDKVISASIDASAENSTIMITKV